MIIKRFAAFGCAIAATIAAGIFLPAPWAVLVFAVSGALTVVGLLDLSQPAHSVRRNYPIVGRLRWFFEDIRPEIRQYLIEDDHEQLPFSRSQRSLVYARSKNESSVFPVSANGTDLRL